MAVGKESVRSEHVASWRGVVGGGSLCFQVIRIKRRLLTLEHFRKSDEVEACMPAPAYGPLHKSSSFRVFLWMEIGPHDPYYVFPLSYVAWSPSLSLVLTYFRPFGQTLACDGILVTSSYCSPWSLNLWKKNSEIHVDGAWVNRSLPRTAPVRLLLTNGGLAVTPYGSFPISQWPDCEYFQMDFLLLMLLWFFVLK